MKVMLEPGAYMPAKAHEDDAGYDLFTPVDIVVKANYGERVYKSFSDVHFGLESVTVDTGVHIAIPKGYVGLIKSRSSLYKRGLITEGVIDSGYTGTVVVKLVNASPHEMHFKAGNKIAQLVIVPICTEGVELTDHLDDTERGDGGFGSTGV